MPCLLCSDPRRCVGYDAYYYAYYLYTERNDERGRGGGEFSNSTVVKIKHGKASFNKFYKLLKTTMA